eukprot:210986-Pyramimonas_sp.AAC.1
MFGSGAKEKAGASSAKEAAASFLESNRQQKQDSEIIVNAELVDKAKRRRSVGSKPSGVALSAAASIPAIADGRGEAAA